MFASAKNDSRYLACPYCGVAQKISFVDGSVGVEQKCISCGSYVKFQLPSFYVWLLNRLTK
jgi:DNA-directed RNA polymerase subunit RPC12/RpoP